MYPAVFLERMQRMLGEEYGGFLEALGRERYQALRLNPLKRRADGRNAAEVFGAGGQVGFEKDAGAGAQVDYEKDAGTGVQGNLEKDSELAVQEFQAAEFAHLSRVPWAEHGYYYETEDRPGKHPFHEAGLYYIQEPSAMMPVELLDIQPGERVLDLCAAPGGKSTQIAAKLKGSGILVCNEIHPARAVVLSENIERMGIGNACVTNETPERLAERFPGYFDKILVDAPCSGEGMFRKNETACEEWRPENVARCAERQDGILDCAGEMLAPGGRLVYSTCTFAPEEDEGSVSRFLRRHEDFEIVPIPFSQRERMGLAECAGVPEYLSDPVPGLEDTVRLWPQRVMGEGHFAAALQKAGHLPKGCRDTVLKGTEKEASEKELDIFREFCRENLRECKAVRKPDGMRKISESVQEPGGEKGKPESVQEPGGEKGKPESVQEPGGEKGKPESVQEPGGEKGKPESVQEPGGMRGRSAAFHELGSAAGMCGEFRAVWFGDNLYLIPAQMPPLKGLKVLRPGLHLGERKKNRFEPSHALALAIAPWNAAHVWNLDSGSGEILSYLNGGTFPAEGEKGWYLICVDGFGAGWGKLAGGMMKNHYPKGLRGRV